LMGNYAGIDWASEKHDVIVCDDVGERLWASTVTNDEPGIRSLCSTLVRLGVELVGIERPDGLLVERLLDAGLRVLALHPNQVVAARSRFRASGGKSDRFDAFVVCELTRTDHHRFRVLEPDSDETKALRVMTRARKDLVQSRVALTNQLRATLLLFWAGPVRLFTELDSPISLAFLERYPSPADASRLGVLRLEAFLRSQHYSGGKSAVQLLGKLRRAPQSCPGDAHMQALRAIVLGLVAAVKALAAQIKALEREIAAALRKHPDGPIFRSLFRDAESFVCAAELLAEIGDCRARYPTADALAAAAGQSAVARESGKYKKACFRRACNANLRTAVCVLADTTRRWHPWAQDRYAAARARRQEHAHAIRTLGRAWCRVLWRCWQDRVPYDPARHRGLQQHLTVTIPTPSGPVIDQAATKRLAGDALTVPADAPTSRKEPSTRT
jgi:transposase